MSQPSLRGRVVLKFPANVVAGYGIIIDKTNSTYTFSVDPSILEGLGGGEGGGIPEAPNDGQQYGRQTLAWTVIVPGGGTGHHHQSAAHREGRAAPDRHHRHGGGPQSVAGQPGRLRCGVRHGDGLQLPHREL